MSNQELIDHLINTGVLKSENIKKALEEADRINFVGESNEDYAYYDDALPIGHGQTISQPLTVVFMLELLDPKEGNIILDVGSGSGWQSCLLASIVGESGQVHAIEIVPEIFKLGKSNCEKLPALAKRISFYRQNAKIGLTEVAQSTGGFDRIICAADVSQVPQSWRDQLKVGGIMVYPKDRGIYKEIKTSENETFRPKGRSFLPHKTPSGSDINSEALLGSKFEKSFYPGFVFVPFVDN